MKSTESKTLRIISAVENYLSAELDKKIKSKILIAFSSGPDSTVLLDVLSRIKENYNLEIICAYYNHRLRESDEIGRELEIAENNCRKRGVELFTGSDDGSIQKEIQALGIEGAARKYRYRFLDKVFNEENCDFIASGHNLDDQIETVVMRLFKGSGASGLKGIPGRNNEIIRPLIYVSKKDIMEYIKENSLTYSVDSTNNEELYLRNRIRKQLLPLSSEIFPGFEKSVITLSEKMDMTEKYIRSETAEKIKWTSVEDGYMTDFNLFFEAPEILQLESLYSTADMLLGNETIRIPYSFFKSVLKKRNTENSTCYLDGYGLKLFRTGRKLYFCRIITTGEQKYITVDTDNKKSIYPINKNRYICIEEKQLADCTEKDLWIDPEGIEGKLFIRFREDGDRISLNCGTKKIKKLFTDMGIRRDLKDRIPLICDDSGIIAVMGSFYGYRDRIAEKIYIDNNINRKVIIFRIRQV